MDSGIWSGGPPPQQGPPVPRLVSPVIPSPLFRELSGAAEAGAQMSVHWWNMVELLSACADGGSTTGM